MATRCGSLDLDSMNSAWDNYSNHSAMDNESTTTRSVENQAAQNDGSLQIQIQSERAALLPPTDGGIQAYMVLLGCALLQLPTWGFAVSYGVFQEFYTSEDRKIDIAGDISSLGMTGTTLNGIIYLSMPLLFGLFTRRLIHQRKNGLLAGTLLSVCSLISSAFADQVWQLILTQGVLQGLGATLLYSSSTIYLDEWFVKRKGFAYGVTLSSKSVIGVAAPLLFSALLSRMGYRLTLLIWAFLVLIMAIPSLLLLRLRNPAAIVGTSRKRKLSWTFLRHSTFYIFTIANIVFSAGYGIPQTYLGSFATRTLRFNSFNAAIMVAALNVPSILANIWFGLLSDGDKSKIFHGRRLSVSSVSALSAIGSCLPVFLLWGLIPPPPEGQNPTSTMNTAIALLVLFATIYGFFSGGYSATWAGVIKEISHEGETLNEAVDTGLVYGLMNGARGIGFVVGGLSSVKLLKAGDATGHNTYPEWSYGTSFGGLIVFAGYGAGLSGVLALSKKIM